MTLKKLLQIAFFISSCLSMFSTPTLADQSYNDMIILHIESDIKIQNGGRLQREYDYFDGAYSSGLSANFEMRRTRFDIKSVLNKNWESKLQVDFTEKEGETETTDKDIYIRYTGWRGMQLTIGKQKEPFGFNRLISSKTVLGIKRPMISNSLTPNRNYGVTLSAYPNNAISIQGGVFSNNTGLFVHEGKQIDANKNLAWTGRVTYAPLKKTDRLIHLGLSGSIRDFTSNEYQLNNRTEVNLADEIVQSGNIKAEKLILSGIEAVTVIKNFSLESEYIRLAIKDRPNSIIQGYYIQASYLLTGEHRPYKKGLFRKIQLRSHSTAWQLLGRYSVLDAEQNNEGYKTTNLTLGMNTYINPSVRVSANYIRTVEKGPDASTSGKSSNGFSVRFQYLF